MKQLAIAIAALLLVSACATPSQQKPPAPTIHTATASPAGILVNGYLIEGPTGVVAVDSALTVSDAKALRARLDALGKPLVAVLLTHGHPDHYNGVGALVEGRSEVPIYSTAQVAQVIRESDAAKEAQWKPMFGAEWPAARTFPNREVKDGESLTLDGLRWTVRALGPGESHADSYWVLEADKRYVFLGDIVLHGVHAYVSDGHTTEWLANLRRVAAAESQAETFFPGHGPAGGAALLDWQQRYLEAYREEVARLRAGSTQLTAEQKAALQQAMKARYPEAGLDFLIGLGADAVAAELAKGQGASTGQ
jgi:glyoxylase-like metal-dependent hydrolase (beta-lactamase superfamily II)